MTVPEDYAAIKDRHIARGPVHASTLPLVRFADMQPRLSDGYLVKHLIGSTTLSLVYGAPGTGKTFYALHLGLCLAAGLECFGRRVRQCGVVYVAAEAGRSIENRVAAARLGREFPDSMPFAAITAPVDLCSNDADLNRIARVVNGADLGMPIGLVIIDTLSRVMAGGNENSPDDMGAFVRNLDLLRAETNSAVLVVHHSGKEASKGARGHSLLRAATDTEIEVTRDSKSESITASVTKQRDLQTRGQLRFALRSVGLGEDQDGDPISSCIVDELPSEVAPPRVRKPVLVVKSHRRALELLVDAIARVGQIPPACDHIPAGTVCISKDLWRRYCDKGMLSRGKNSGKRMAFERASTALIAQGVVGYWSEMVWPI